MAAQPLTSDQRNSFVAALLGWMMDAFDYFLVVLVYAVVGLPLGPLTPRLARESAARRSGDLCGRALHLAGSPAGQRDRVELPVGA